MSTRALFLGIACLLAASAARAAGPYLYVGNNGLGADSVSVIDLNTNTVITTLPTGNRTGPVALSSDASRAYAINTFADGISVIDTVTHKVINTLPQPYIALALFLNPARAELYHGIIGSDVVRVQPVSGGSGSSIALGGPRAAALTTNLLGTRLFTANNPGDSVSVIDTATQQVLSTIPLSATPSAIRSNLSGTTLFVSTTAGTDVVDVASATVISTISGPAAITLNAATTRLWRLDSSGQLCPFNITVVPPTPLPCGTISVTTPSGMVLGFGDSRLYVANYSTDTVHVFDLTQGTAFPSLATIAVGDAPVIGPQSVASVVGRDAPVGAGEWSGTLYAVGNDSLLQLTLEFYDNPLDAFGTTVNLGTLIGQAGLVAGVGPGQPPLSRSLSNEIFSAPINVHFLDGAMRCVDACTTNEVILSGRLVDLSGQLPANVGYRIEGSLQSAEPLTSSSNIAVAGTFTLTAIASANTPPGFNVTVHGGTDEIPVTVTYAGVGAAGSTLIEVNLGAAGAFPANFGLNLPPLYISISTDAPVTPPITVCIGYGSTGLSDEAAEFVTLWHAPDGAYDPETTYVDEDNDMICANVQSLSPFALAQPQPPRSGFVPVDTTAAICAAGAAKASARLARAIGKCHTRVASDALAGKTPAEEACESDARIKFDEKIAGLVGCPACVSSGASALRDRTEQLMNGLNTGIYCDGTALVGSDNLGSVPLDETGAACAKKVVKALGKRANALASCHKRAAKAALKGKFFDADGCETEAAAKFMATALNGCPACLTDGLRAIGVQLESSIDRDNGLAYCDGAIPFP